MARIVGSLIHNDDWAPRIPWSVQTLVKMLDTAIRVTRPLSGTPVSIESNS